MRAFLILSVVATTSACEPSFSLHGTVADAVGLPIDAARIELRCPTEFDSAVSDATGHYRGRRIIGFCPNACRVHATAPGYAEASVPVTDVCESSPWYNGDVCLKVAWSPRLQRARR